jgi:flagellar biosynthesis/type III secretory pathway protein FliH
MNPGTGSNALKRDEMAKRSISQGFPSLATLKRSHDTVEGNTIEHKAAEEFEKARSSGYQRGYEDGLNAARAEAAKLYESARTEGHARGMAEGRKEAARTLEALKGVNEELSKMYANLLSELETFSLEFCFGLLRRLTGANPLRRAFLTKAIKEAVVALKPSGVQAIVLSPTDMAVVDGLLDGLNVKEDPMLEPGGFRVEAATLFVEGSLSAAMAQVERAMVKKKPATSAQDSSVGEQP